MSTATEPAFANPEVHLEDAPTENYNDDDHPEDPPPAPAGPVYYKYVDLGLALAPDAFLPVQKARGLYVAPLARPLLVQTPAVTLASPLADEDEPPTHVHLALPKAFAQFAAEAETRVLEACLENKSAWFRKALDDDVLRARFKEFAKNGHLKVKLPPGAVVFDADGRVLDRAAVPEGASLRCLLDLSRVCFGRTEFGASWSLVQAQVAPPPPPPPKCMIDPAAEHDGPAKADDPSAADLDFHDFL